MPRPSPTAAASFFALLVTMGLGRTVLVAAQRPYAIYNQGKYWRSDLCAGPYISKDDAPHCYDEANTTPEQRSRLWAALDPDPLGTAPSRKVDTMFMHKVYSRLENVFAGECDETVMATIAAAHQRGVRVYGLYDDEEIDFGAAIEQSRRIKRYNDHCGGRFGAAVKFDGVASNNEKWKDLNTEDCDDPNHVEKLQWLTGLQATKEAAGGLPLHLSIGYRWGYCNWRSAEENRVINYLEWNGSRKPAYEHMMDIADSVDIQVAWYKPSSQVDRALVQYNYWFAQDGVSVDDDQGTFYVTAYVNPVADEDPESHRDCYQSFAPHLKTTDNTTVIPEECGCDDSEIPCDRTQNGLWNVFDTVEDLLPGSRMAIHYYGGVYSTGLTDGWPVNKPERKARTGEPCSIDADCRYYASCDVVPGTFFDRVCGEYNFDFDLQPLPFPKPTICLPSGFECKTDKDCCKGDCIAPKPCDCKGSKWCFCRWHKILPSRCE